MTARRLAQGGLIDRARTVGFTFDGRRYGGYAGDTLASALLANDVTLVGRSFKYHRPRGILSAGSEEPNALVELGEGARREPNTRATVVELFEGLAARSQNRFPSLKFDLLSINGLVAPLLAAGFYYKTFMWPAPFWEKVYEPLIRRAAGLGRNAGQPDPAHYEKIHAFCDVLVIGGGRSGIAAALAAAASGARVILCDENAALGGRALAEGEAADVAALAAHPNIRVLTRCTVFGVFDGGTYGAVERVTDHLAAPPAHLPRQRLWTIVAARSVLATGAIERPLLFGNNDLPGVMLAGAVRATINRYAVAPGSRAVLYANNDDAARTIPVLRKAGITLAAAVDTRGTVPQATRQAAAQAGAQLFTGATLSRAFGRQRLGGVEIIDADGALTRLRCDLLAMSGGWTPSLHLATYLGHKPAWDEARGVFIPRDLPPGMSAAGRAAGNIPAAGAPPATDKLSGKVFVDFQNDVTISDVKLARAEGFGAVEHLKRYTTLGMATDQGKTSNMNALGVLAGLSGRGVAELTTTTFRPPYTPVAIGALAGVHRGEKFKPARLTPTHEWAAALGAKFGETGLWLRAQYFPRAGEDWFAATTREVNAVRGAVGICDVTTLGKIDIQGPDAARLLDFVYTNGWQTLGLGRARYGLMLRDDGFVMDDGTTTRLGERHYLMTTTTANAAKVMQHLELCRQVLLPTLDVQIVSVTEQWAQLAVAGPRSRDVLREIIDPAYDISNVALPYMGAIAVTVCGGLGARLFRLSFSGELAYELAVPAHYGAALAARLMHAGAPHGITPYGTEALGVLRIEKGHAAGAELDGRTTAHDLGLAKLLSTRKDFVGRALASRPALTDPARPTLVGLKPVEPTARLRAGAHLLPRGAALTAANDQGHVSSTCFSPSLNQWIGLGLLQHGPARHGEIIRVYDPIRGGDLLAEVVPPVFVDPEGSRLRA